MHRHSQPKGRMTSVCTRDGWGRHASSGKFTLRKRKLRKPARFVSHNKTTEDSEVIDHIYGAKDKTTK